MVLKVPEETRVVNLQQTDAGDIDIDEGPGKTSSHPTNDRSVLEEVIERATARHEAQRELNGKAPAYTPFFSNASLQRSGITLWPCMAKVNLDLLQGVKSTDPFGALRSLRKIQRERLQKDLFFKTKDAKLRSGARGMQARKALIATETTVAEFETMYAAASEHSTNRREVVAVIIIC